MVPLKLWHFINYITYRWKLLLKSLQSFAVLQNVVLREEMLNVFLAYVKMLAELVLRCIIGCCKWSLQTFELQMLCVHSCHYRVQSVLYCVYGVAGRCWVATVSTVLK